MRIPYFDVEKSQMYARRLNVVISRSLVLYRACKSQNHIFKSRLIIWQYDVHVNMRMRIKLVLGLPVS